MTSRTRSVLLASTLLIGAAAGPVLAQGAAPAAPPAAAPAAKPATPAPRTRIELPVAERQAMDKSTDSGAPTLKAEDLVPGPADQNTPPPDERGPRIEQRRTSNRVSEITVTPAFGAPSYVITNREGRQPTSITDMSSGLSIPKFFSFDFGRPTTNPAAPPPPPTR